jgi:DNA recombination protein RmuC
VTVLVVALAVALAAAVTLVLLLVLRRPAADHSALLQQQLVELRAQLAQIASAQQAVPRALAESRAAQSESLAGELRALSTTVGQRLDTTGRAVADVRERLGQLAEATRKLETMGESVVEVQQLLQVPRLRGTLGEVWLEELLRQIFPASHWERQWTYRSGERVDAIVRVGDRHVPVDAKFPLDACQRMLAAPNDEVAERERRLLRRSIRDRVDEIATKYIRPDEGTFDFALMYVPAEAVYYEAVVRGDLVGDDASVLGYAMARRVIPVSPHTFYAYLSAVLHGLKGMRVEERAREIQSEIAALGVRFERYWSAYEKVGTHLGNAARQYAESERLAGKVREQLGAIADGRDAEPATVVAALG